ncbi:hypothetical protein H5410_004886, partial [Solanum commersonii]
AVGEEGESSNNSEQPGENQQIARTTSKTPPLALRREIRQQPPAETTNNSDSSTHRSDQRNSEPRQHFKGFRGLNLEFKMLKSLLEEFRMKQLYLSLF